MHGHLHLVAAAETAKGRTFLQAQSFQAPMHVGKGHWNPADRWLTVFAVNATAGLFAGDRIDTAVTVGPGARLRLVSPSAVRVFRHARPGVEANSADAETRQTFRVAGAGASLEVWPEGFIPHAGCRHRQTTRVEVAGGGAALLWEIVAPGRVAAGEAWAFERLHWALDIFANGMPVVRDRWDVAPVRFPESVAGWQVAGRRKFRGPPFYASAYLVGTTGATIGMPDPEALSEAGAECWVGASRLARDAGWMVKILAADGAVLRRTLGRIRPVLLASLGS